MANEIPPLIRPKRRRALSVLVFVALGALVGFGIFASLRTDTPSPLPDLTPPALDNTIPLLDGERAAPFSVNLFSGEQFDLERHLASDSRPVFLNLWASWCLPCRKEMPAIDASAMRHPGVMFLGIAVQDDPIAAQAFAEEIGVTYPLAFDEGEIVDARYPSFGLPVSFIISEDGFILEQIFGEVSEEEITAKLATWFGG